jgi:hypothetical protein
MATRREFLQSSAAALAVAAARPIMGWQGANNRVRMAVIGCGNRAARVFDSFIRSGGDGVQYVAACEVNKAKLDQWMTPARQTFKLDVVEDYRRILDRKDVDAVLIGTPDFSHSQIMVDAIAAGKDVYCEKPASNTVARINAMLDAYKKSDRVVQIGTHQRSWDHFADAKKFVDDGTLGKVTQVVIVQLRASEGSGSARAGWFELGPLADGRTKASVQAVAPRLPRVVRVWERSDRRLGRASCRRRALVHERRQQGSSQDDGERRVPHGAGRRSRDGP